MIKFFIKQYKNMKRMYKGEKVKTVKLCLVLENFKGNKIKRKYRKK